MAIRSMQIAGGTDNFDTRELARAAQIRKEIDKIYKSVEAYKAIEPNLGMQGFEEYEGGKESEGVASFKTHETGQAGVEKAVKALQRSGFKSFQEHTSAGLLAGSADIKGVRVHAMIQPVNNQGVRVMLTFGVT